MPAAVPLGTALQRHEHDVAGRAEAVRGAKLVQRVGPSVSGDLGRRAGSHQTVTDIAFRWGFNDMAHFSRTFKQAFGVIPSSVLSRGRTVAADPAGGPSDSHPVRMSLCRWS